MNNKKMKSILLALLTLSVCGPAMAKLAVVQKPLHQAAQAGDASTVAELIAESVDLNAETSVGGRYTPIDARYTALKIASIYGHVDVIQLLVKAGASINFRVEYGRSPLLLAVKFNHEEAVRVLLSTQADLSARDHTGYSSLDYALENGYDVITGMLIEAGASTDGVDKTAVKPLGHWCNGEYVEAGSDAEPCEIMM